MFSARVLGKAGDGLDAGNPVEAWGVDFTWADSVQFTIAASAAATFYSLVGQLFLYDFGTSDPQSARLELIEAAPDCGFDEHFGFPCTYLFTGGS